MFLVRLFPKTPSLAHVMDAAAFRRAIEEERMRVDRGASQFTLVVFTRRSAHTPLERQQLAAAAHRRLRLVDRVGWLANGEMALLLPGTDVAGAQTLADEIQRTLPGGGGSMTRQIYVYPDTELPGAQILAEREGCAACHSADELLVDPLPLWKRMLDLTGAACGLALCSPIMLLAAIAIKLDSRGPVLFTQTRSGLGGRPFTIYKFRTMHVGADELKHALRGNSEQDGPAFKIKNDPRVTRVGRYLRRTCLDEFPQFWNVLRGDMSLVGPRPLPCDEADECEPWQRKRLAVTPGLTCIWQVSGGMQVSFVEWMRMDIRYLRSRRLVQDLGLMGRTVLAMLFHRASH